MLTAAILYVGFILLTTSGGILITRVGAQTRHVAASAAGVVGCVLASAAATIALSLSGAIAPF